MFVHRPYIEAELTKPAHPAASGQGRQIKMPNPYNPYDSNKDCLLTFVTGRRTSYYSHRYTPTHTKVFNYRKSAMREIFNLQVDTSTRRCNCIAMTLYITQFNIFKLLGYLYSIQRSVVNVDNNLADWLIRLYVDGSVFALLEPDIKPPFTSIPKEALGYYTSTHWSQLPYKQDLATAWFRAQATACQLFQTILASPNVEVYRLDCGGKDNNKDNDDGQVDTTFSIHWTRIFRFLPLLDTLEDGKYGINACAVREADGIVSQLDCHNLKAWSSQQVNQIFYLIPLFYETAHTEDHYSHSYSKWLNIYKNRIAKLDGGDNYFASHNNLYDLLAGTIAVKYKVKASYFYSSIRQLLAKRQLYNQTVAWGDETNDASFDEELLLEMFAPLISARRLPTVDEDTLYYQEDYDWIMNHVLFERHNITLLFFDLDSPVESLEKLVDEGVLRLSWQQLGKLADLLAYYHQEQMLDNIRILDLLFNSRFLHSGDIHLYNITSLNHDWLELEGSTHRVERALYNNGNTTLTLVNTPYYSHHHNSTLTSIDKFYPDSLNLSAIRSADNMYEESATI